MAVTSGFFNAKNHDRKYDATQMSSLFEGIIKDGVFQSVGNIFATKVTSGMNVTVDTGRAWFNNTWTNNDALIVLTVPAAEQVLKRIDAVVLEVNLNESVRANSIKIKQGTPASTPVAPSMTKSDEIYQYPLAYITVDPNVTNITQAKIKNKVGSSDCPFVTGLMEAGDIDNLTMQWATQFNTMFAELEEQISQATSGTIIDGSVTRVKLANDALYSPIKSISGEHALSSNDLGVTLVGADGVSNSIQITAAISAGLPQGFAVAYAKIFASDHKISVSGVRLILSGDGQIATSSKTVTLQLSEDGNMVALKKMLTDNTNGDIWLITGPAEVAS